MNLDNLRVEIELDESDLTIILFEWRGTESGHFEIDRNCVSLETLAYKLKPYLKEILE